MSSRIQIVLQDSAAHSPTGRWLLGLLLVTLAFPVITLAQSNPSGAIGRVEGADISVEGNSPTGSTGTMVAHSIVVLNGGIVMVHSGQARMVFIAGGQVDICGPAKFTVLQASGAITLALNFGRLRVQLPASTALRIFTPTIVATPLDISGGVRDMTVGLDLNDSLCITATSGAIRLEHQFTGETLDVPQSGEFFLESGKLVPVVGTPGTCQCNVTMEAHVTRPASPPIPEVGLTSPAQAALAPDPEPAAPPSRPIAAATPPKQEPEEPLVQLRVLEDANKAHPIAPPEKNAMPDPPATSIPEYIIVMPPMKFSAASPAPPDDPAPNMILLVRVAHIEPQWEFGGHVEAPQLVQVAASKPAPAPTGPETPESQPAQQSQKKKRGFWASLKRAFGGSDETQN